jgi:imidazolonepropionase-like amidohydrolase
MNDQAGDQATLIRRVRVFDGFTLGDPTAVLTVGDRIAAVGADLVNHQAAVVDGNGGVLLPGLIDAHVHLHDLPNLEQLARHGVTTALDMACWPPERVDTLRHRRGLTDIRSAGTPATSTGSTHARMPGMPTAALLDGPGGAEEFVAARIAEGSDYIKLIADVPGPDQATLDALVAAARSHGKRSVAHAASTAAWQMAVAAGVDVVTHTPLDKPLADDLVRRMSNLGQVSVPTLCMMEAVATGIAAANPALAGRPGVPDYRNARASVATLHAAGIPILAGTDANAAPGAPAAVPHGQSLHHELALLVDAGLSNVDALRAATCLPATHFGLDDRGRIEVGLRADLILLDGDPTADIAATQQLRGVWCGGIACPLP